MFEYDVSLVVSAGAYNTLLAARGCLKQIMFILLRRVVC